MASQTDTWIHRLANLDSTVVSDALDGLGLPPGLGGLVPQWGAPRVVGRVRTVELEDDPGDAPGPHLATPVVAATEPGDVVVVANGGRLDVSCWGGLLSLGSVRRGVAGVIADGACRDVAEAEGHGLPVFARGASPRTARGRLRQRTTGQPVRIDGVPVDEGDLVLADDSGVVFVPRGEAERVIAAATRIRDREQAIAADIRRGVPIDRAMHDARLAGDDAGPQSDCSPPAGPLDGLPTAKDRVRLRAVQQPLRIGGVPVRPGDQVYCDEDGAVVVPAERAAEVAALARRIERAEAAIVEAVRSGSTLADARVALGYHSLQAPSAGGA